MPDNKPAASSHRFDEPASTKPSDIFHHNHGEFAWSEMTRFVNLKAIGEYLIFISGLCATEEDTKKEARNRAVYAYVWGPHHAKQDENHVVRDFHPNFDPPTAERAQLLAAFGALALVLEWKARKTDITSIVLAYSGNYFRNHVACSSYNKEVVNGRNNLDLKKLLFRIVEFVEEEGVKVRFWQIDTGNRADDVAGTRLYGTEHPLMKIVKLPLYLESFINRIIWGDR